jgi:oligopeptide/dipeptide ABC transporter ATP-binding protein
MADKAGKTTELVADDPGQYGSEGAPVYSTSLADSVIDVADLYVEFPTVLGVVRALNGVNYRIPRGKVLGVVGESGSGKSVTARAIMQILERPGRITSGAITFRRGSRPDDEERAAHRPKNAPKKLDVDEVDIAKLEPDSDEIRGIRGEEIAMIFQEPMTSLNPLYTIGNQIEEGILLHQTDDKAESKRRAVDILRQVGMPNPDRIHGLYPHELSGGMRQRAMIAMALSCRPSMLIADEPTTALDVTTEAQILELMRGLQRETGMSILFITHSMGVVAQICDDVVVMYLGRIVERAPVEEIFHNPKHPYTISLLRSIPRFGMSRDEPLEVIHGSVPDPYTRVPGCSFHPRCPASMPGICDVIVPVEAPIGAPGHGVRCHLYPGSTPKQTVPQDVTIETPPAEGRRFGRSKVASSSKGA